MVFFGKDGASAITDGVHQEHQCHAGSEIRKHIELHFFALRGGIERDRECVIVGCILQLLPHLFAYGLCLLWCDAPADHHLQNGSLCADRAFFHAAHEFIQNGFDDARAGGAGGVGIQLDLYNFGSVARCEIFLLWDDAAREASGDDDGCRDFIFFHLKTSRFGTHAESWFDQISQVFRVEKIHQSRAQFAVILIDDDHGNICNARGVAAETPRDQAHAEGQQERRNKHEDQCRAVTKNEAQVFDADEKGFNHRILRGEERGKKKDVDSFSFLFLFSSIPQCASR